MPGRFLVLLSAAAAALGIAGAATHSPAIPESGVSGRPIQQRDGGYVSSDTCRACHPSQYASWHASYHHTMTQVATPATAIADFRDQTITSVQGRPMRLQERGAQLWAEFDDPDSNEAPGQRPRIERQVTLITGSHHQQIFWYATSRGRVLGQLPAAYLVNEARWIPRRMAVLHPPQQTAFSETTHWNSTCVACHATNGKPQFDNPPGSASVADQNAETTVAEFGIACESCHGPGESHVRANRSALRRYWLHFTGAPDPTIVLPSRLSAVQSAQVCGQCHSVWEFYDQAGERFANANGLPFRPGQTLSDSRFVAQPTQNLDSPTMQALLADDARFLRDAFWSDGTVRVSGREYNGLIESPCYRNATSEARRLTCSSCHAQHRPDDDRRSLAEWADDQLLLSAPTGQGADTADVRDGNAACLQCHPALRGKESAHSHHAAGSAGNACNNCHMPYTTYGLLKTIRSHTIGSPTVRESIETGRPNGCNLCHLDRTLSWTAGALNHWYGTPEVPLGVDEKNVAASLLWLLKGDAGQRAIVAQAMAWPAAREASGTDWLAPYLAQLLDDPYDAVRFAAARTLASVPGFGPAAEDVTQPSAARRQAQLRTMARWDRLRHESAGRAELLIAADGALDVPRVLDLLRQRNNRTMLLRE